MILDFMRVHQVGRDVNTDSCNLLPSLIIACVFLAIEKESPCRGSLFNSLVGVRPGLNRSVPVVGRDDVLAFERREQVTRFDDVAVCFSCLQDGHSGDRDRTVHDDGGEPVFVLLPELLQSVHWGLPFVVVSL